ncbi:hypothetical protein [Flavobacterium sp. 5]|uniref:hypothetical protein n=1 Tax=Flavobacterium sp. 5 TaxID=2035199 RepID=UPI000C2C4638|nr:hypothetical protein [Flavobacterium sp. 5]PKB16623.1 hypothetical protein CLU82_1764 [Flavobacterium sp. 5]
MKQLYSKLYLLLTISVLLLVSCSKEDTTEEPIKEVGGEISRSQLVTINLPDANLSNNEYQGDFDGVTITLIKSGNDKLVFLLPYSTTLGVHTLTIPALNSATFTYDVKDTLLTGTPDAAMSDLFVNLNTFEQNLDDSQEATVLKNAINTFNTQYESASIQEKTQIAILYSANKANFDKIFSFDAATTKGFSFSLPASVGKHIAAVGLMGAAVLLIPTSPILGGVAALAGAYKAYKANEEIIDNTVLTIATHFGYNSGKREDAIFMLTDGVETTIKADFIQRGIITGDRANTNPSLQQYFESYDQYNYYAEKENIEIQKANASKGLDYGSVTLETLKSSDTETAILANSENFKNIQFSISDSNLELVSSNLEKDGQLNFEVKIKENSSQSVVESFIDYKYTDEISSFSGKLPIKVVRSIVGTWEMESFNNGLLLGQYDDVYFNCNIVGGAYTYTSEVLVFTENTYTTNGTSNHIYYNFQTDKNCVVTEDGKDTQETINDSSNGTYILKGNSLEVTDAGEVSSIPLIFISNNKLKVGENVYVRKN